METFKLNLQIYWIPLFESTESALSISIQTAW